MSEKKEEPITDKKISRRSLLKYTGALAAGVVVGVAAEYGATYKPPPPPPPSFKPPLSPDVQTRVNAVMQQLVANHAGETIKYTSCKQNGCWETDLLECHVKNGVLTAIGVGDPLNAGQPREDVSKQDLLAQMIQRRPCVRGHGWRMTLYNPDRALYPMKNVGVRGNPKWVRITWQEALDTVAANMKTVIQKYGPYSMRSPPGCGGWIGAAFSNWGVASFGAHVVADLATYGANDDSRSDIRKEENLNFFYSKLIIGFGIDPSEIWYEASYNLLRVREMGIPIVIISPTFNVSCEVLADQWIPIRPGTDTAMMLAMANVLFKESLYNQAYVAKFVEPTGFAMWKDYVLGNTAGPDGKIDRTPEWASPICGVPATTIRALAELYGKTQPCCLIANYSVARANNGDLPARAGKYLQAMTGNVGVDGGGSSTAGYGQQSYLPVPSTSSKRKPAKVTAPPSLMYDRAWPNSILMRPDLDQGKISDADYRRRMGTAVGVPLANIHMLYVSGSTNLGQMNLNEVYQAITKLDYTASCVYMMTNPIAFFSDIVMPLADLFFESDPAWYNSSGNGNTNHVIWGSKVVEPPGEARPSAWIDMQLAKRFGVDQDYFPELAVVEDNYPSGWDAANLQLHQTAYTTWSARSDIAFRKPPTWDDFKKAPIFRIPHGKPSIGFRDEIERGIPFDTPSGKIEFYCSFLASPDSTTKNFVLPTQRVLGHNGDGPGETIVNTPADTGVCVGGTTTPMAEWVPPWNSMITSPNLNQYPLTVLSSHSYYRQHTSQDNNPWFRNEFRHACWISAADAQTRGIKDNDLVRVHNENAEMVLPAYVTSRCIPGVVVVHHSAWYEPNQAQTQLMPFGVDRRGSVNFLTTSKEYPWILGAFPATHLVQVEKF